MVNILSHGGGCCGVRHMNNFWAGASPEELDRRLAPYPTSDNPRAKGKLIEAVITDAQFLQNPDLAQNLKDKGFRFVARFDNSSGSICNVFHRVTGERDIRGSRARWTRVFRD